MAAITLAVLTAYLVIALGLDAPFLFGHQSIFAADATYNVEPVARYIREVWSRTGHLPLWNPYVLGGAPQSQLIWPLAYMPGYVFLLAGFSAATGWFLLLHQLVSGVGGFVWQYSRRRAGPADERWLPASIFGLIYMLSGYMAGSTINLQLFAAAAWIPLALFLLDRAIASPRPWCLGALGFVLGLQVTAGRPEIFAVSLLVYGSYLARELRIGRRQANPGTTWKAAAIFAGSATLALAFAAIDLLPMLELVSWSPAIGSLSALKAGYWSAGWYDLAGLVFSQLIGPVGMGDCRLYPTYPGDMPYLTSMYVSAPAATLALVGFCRRDWDGRRFWLCWLLAALALSAGRFGPLISLLEHLQAGWNVFRFPIKLSIFLILPLACAAAEGGRALAGGQAGGRAVRVAAVVWLPLAACGLALLTVPGWHRSGLLAWSGGDLAELTAGGMTRWQRMGLELVVAGLSGAATCALCAGPLAARLPRRLAVGAVLAMTACLLAVNGANQLWHTVDDSFFSTRSAVASWLRDRSGGRCSGWRALNLLEDPLPAPPAVRHLPPAEVDRAFMQYAREVLRPNTNLDNRIALVNGVSTIPGWSSYFLSTGVLPRSALMPATRHPAGKSDLPLYRFCQATSTAYVITPVTGVAGDGGACALPRLDASLFDLLKQDDRLNLRIFAIRRPRPRAGLVGGFRVMPDRIRALTEINRCDTTGYDPLSEVLIADPPALGENLRSPPAGGVQPAPPGRSGAGREEILGSVEILSESPNHLVIRADVRRPAFLVVTDSFYPGWDAVDNGVPSRIYLADGLMRAVWLEAGQHLVSMDFRPWSVFIGSICSKLTLVVLIGLALPGLIVLMRPTHARG